jgi:hypothetical protein
MHCFTPSLLLQASSTAAPAITARRSAAVSRATKRRAPAAPLRAASATTDQQLSAFEAISQGTDRKYILVSGKGGVGKTSLSASLAVRLAAEGHTTLVVSTDPAHSLGDSLAQDLSGGKPMPLEGTDLPLWGMEIDPEEAKAELKVRMHASMPAPQLTGSCISAPAAGQVAMHTLVSHGGQYLLIYGCKPCCLNTPSLLRACQSLRVGVLTPHRTVPAHQNLPQPFPTFPTHTGLQRQQQRQWTGHGHDARHGPRPAGGPAG